MQYEEIKKRKTEKQKLKGSWLALTRATVCGNQDRKGSNQSL
jgi:hypothetical protein